jgi:hypothetical protein
LAAPEPVVLFTQTANADAPRREARVHRGGRFEAYGAEQWFGLRPPVTPSD